MKRCIQLVGGLLLLACGGCLAQSTTLRIGDKAPDFELTDQNRQKIRLSDFAGRRNVVVAFYVLAFTGG